MSFKPVFESYERYALSTAIPGARGFLMVVQRFLNGDLTHKALENTLARELIDSNCNFERKILKALLNWVELLPPFSLNHELSENARISVFSNFILNLLFTVQQTAPPVRPPKRSDFGRSSSEPSKATFERKVLNDEAKRGSSTRHDFAGHVLAQRTPTVQSVDGEAKKSHASSALASIHLDLARLGVARRDGLLAIKRRGIETPYHISLQVVASSLIFYASIYVAADWCAMLELGKVTLPESWEDSKFLGFIEDLDVAKRTMLLYPNQVDRVWILLNDPTMKPAAGTGNVTTKVMITPQAKKTMDTTKNCERPTNMSWD
ncbi:hypothetical protein BC832DRAFT_540318 [Gaertneriomyces semiglobifer]|nr:hypothetical protein BC832DRAFT_540318 [Gaertneriomyces semiglobifer]